MVVSKFGGTSVQNASAIKNVFNIIKNKSGKTVVVVSAFSGITNELTELIRVIPIGDMDKADGIINQMLERHLRTADELNLPSEVKDEIGVKLANLSNLTQALGVLGEVTPKSADRVLSLGEDLSSLIVTSFFNTMGIKAVFIDSRKLIYTDKNFNEGNIDFALTNQNTKKLINQAFQESDVVVTQGFVASTLDGDTITLGRGGSDYSASVIGAAISADRVEIWTDVDGILTSDPRHIKNVKLIDSLSYEEASELAFFGAKVLHPKTIFPAVSAQIPVVVLNSFNTESKGTTILKTNREYKAIKAISFRRGTSVIQITSNRMLGTYGFLSKVFEIFNHHKTPVDIVTTSEVSVSLTIDDNENINDIINDLKKIASVKVSRNMGIVVAVGEGIRDTAGIAARFFGTLRGFNILMVSIGSSDINISIVMEQGEIIEAVQMLHNEFLNGQEIPA
jgi:aspartate kinase